MKSKVTGIFWGIVLIAVGVIFTGNIVGLWDISLFFSGWWTLFIIVPCLYSFVCNGIHLASGIGFLIGVDLLLACLGVYNWDVAWKLLVPIILVAAGIAIIINRTFSFRHSAVAGLKKPGQPEYEAVFSAQNIRFNGEEFYGAEANAVFGSIEIDLTNAVFRGDACLEVNAVFGGVKIITPENVRVKTSITPVFGGMTNARKKNDDGDASKPILYIAANCVFGGGEIR